MLGRRCTAELSQTMRPTGSPMKFVPMKIHHRGQGAEAMWLLRRCGAHIHKRPISEALLGGECIASPITIEHCLILHCRSKFVSASVVHLFSTTYDQSDDLTISSLLTYLNAAIPLDKFEDFDTTEVVRAATQMRERGDVSFEGDVLRLKTSFR